LKDNLFLQWFAKYCQNVPYIFKGDDDVFVNTENIVEFLKDLSIQKRLSLFRGSVLYTSERVDDPSNRYYVNKSIYSKSLYPPYVSGDSFVMSNLMAINLFQASLKARIIPIDDAYLGILLRKIGLKPQDDQRFGNWNKPNSTINICKLSKLKTFHGVYPKKMLEMWKNLMQLNNSKCKNN